ncbi:MAG: response regulator [bacterium]
MLYKEYPILFIDDEPDALETITFALKKTFTIESTNDPFKALEIIKEKEYAVVLSDQKMPKMQGFDLLTKVKKISPLTIRVLITGFADIEDAIKAINKGEIYRYIPKKTSSEERESFLRQAIDFYALQREKERLCRANQQLLKRLAVKDKILGINNFGYEIYAQFLPMIEEIRDELYDEQKESVMEAANLNIPWRSSRWFREKLEKIEKITNSLQELYLATSHNMLVPLKEEGDLNKIIREKVDYYKKLEDWREVKFNLDLDEKIPPFKMNVEDIGYAIRYILVNSGQAIPDNGDINIKTIFKTDDAGEYVILEIADHGRGIKKEDINKVFVPFFGTKKGCPGLGLTKAETIFANHDATIEIKSGCPETAGTTVTVTFLFERKMSLSLSEQP